MDGLYIEGVRKESTIAPSRKQLTAYNPDVTYLVSSQMPAKRMSNSSTNELAGGGTAKSRQVNDIVRC